MPTLSYTNWRAASNMERKDSLACHINLNNMELKAFVT
jgi:hypothetical protein